MILFVINIDGVLKYVRVVSKNEDDENFWKGEVDGKMGLFPKDFVKDVSPKKTSKETEFDQGATKTASKVRKEIYQVIYDYKAENDDELTIKQKEVIESSKIISRLIYKRFQGCNNSGQKC